MKHVYQPAIHIAFSFTVLILALFVIHDFFLPAAWAIIIAISTWPLYQILISQLKTKQGWAALIMTVLIVLIVMLPLSWLIYHAIHDAIYVVHYIIHLDKVGHPTPTWFKNIPLVGKKLVATWQEYFVNPRGVTKFLANEQISLHPTSKFMGSVGVKTVHAGMKVFFTIITLYFLFRYGYQICVWFDHIGVYCLGNRWHLYISTLPKAIKATVNGSVFVGLGVGLLLGLCYLVVGVSAPILLGVVSGIFAMVPFGTLFSFLIVALIQLAQGGLGAAIIIVVWGGVVMFIADHFVRPKLIGDGTKLPFLAVLFGVLGGVDTMGMIGLFLGPAIMVLLMTLLNEPRLKANGDW